MEVINLEENFMPQSFMQPEGIYDPTLRFAFTNITEEDFVSAWDGNPMTVPPGASIEVPQYLAVKFTGELVDKIMISEVKLDEVTHYKNNPNAAINTYRGPSSLGVPAARKVWEDQICRQLAVDEESPQMQVIRAQIRAELQDDLNTEVTKEPPHIPSSLDEFADLTATPTKVVKPPLKVKKIVKK